MKSTARNLHSKRRNLNLGGSVVTLDAVQNEIPTNDGLLSEDGWYYIVDTGNILHPTAGLLSGQQIMCRINIALFMVMIFMHRSKTWE